MKNKIFSLMTVAMATVSLFFVGCEDEMSGIGNSISSSDVAIHVDSLVYNLDASTVEAPSLESKSAYSLLGSISVPEYGDLNCSYVTQFLPAESLNLPDTIKAENIDSVKIMLTIPKALVTGDSLAPQQMKVFSLIKELPENLSSSFNPEGYYEPQDPLAVKSYTLSGYKYNDSTYLASKVVGVKANLPLELGRKVVEAYTTNPDLFIWPQEFAKVWPGIYVAPTFGKGCISAIQSTTIFAYFPKTVMTTETDEDGKVQTIYKQMADSVCMFTTAPEVLSSVNIDYQPSENIKSKISEGKSIITTPGGYTVQFKFPAEEILKDYWTEEYNLGVINNMVFSLQAKTLSNSFGIGLPPSLLMVKTSEMENFFSEGKLPDNKSSFYSLLSPDTNTFTFSSMREYIVNLKEKGEGNITDDDISFTLIPVSISTEEYTDYSTGKLVTVVTAIAPYVVKPTMMELDTQNASIVFTYSNQTLN